MSRSLFHKFLYRSAGLAVILALTAAIGFCQADEEAPQVVPRKKQVKRDTQPRAIGLLRMSGGKATLIPIAIMVDKKFYDASAYKAAPVPMALETGTVYEAERSGESLGLFTVAGALHSVAENTPAPWLGTGMFQPAGAEPAKKPSLADDTPVGIEPADVPPRLSRAGTSPQNVPADKAPASTPPPGKPSESQPPAAPQSGPGAGSVPASPPAANGGGSAPPASPSTQPSNPPNTTTPAPPPSPPGASSPSAGKPSSQSPITAQDSGPPRLTPASQDSGGPRLRRGKPTESLPEDDIPGYAKVGANGSVTRTANPGDAKGPSPSSEPVQLVPAISDAGGPQPRSYRFDWSGEDQEKRRKQMLEMAGEEFRNHLKKEAQGRISATPIPKQTAPVHPPVHKTPTKPQEPIFENLQFQAFDVWLNNSPVLILSGEAHMPPPPHGAAGAPSASYTILLVARTDIYGNLRKLYWGATDKFHLDVTPRLELIDAVDADGDGRGELLFKETSDAGTGYVIYRPTADVLWKLFDSLNQD